MSEIDILRWALTIVLGGFVWFMKRTLDKVEKDMVNTQNDIAKIKEDYLHKQDFKDFKVELRGMFEEIKNDIRALPKH